MANPGENQFSWFLRNRIAPLYHENPPPRRHRAAARRVLALHAQGQIGLHAVTGNAAVRGQVEELARSGIVSATTSEGELRLIPPLWLLEVLIALAEASTAPGNFTQLNAAQQGRRVPFYVLSLVRLRGNSDSLHYVGRGIAITRYDGHQINMRDPATAFEGVIGVMRNLPRGRYGLGLPRVPSEGPFGRCVPAAGAYDQTGRWRVGRAGLLFEATCGDLRERTDDYAQFRYFYLGAPAVEPIFRPEYRQANPRHPWGLINPFLDRRLREGHSPGGIEQDLRRFEMPVYAQRLEQAALLARHSHGAEIEDLFPDKPNHLHLSLLV